MISTHLLILGLLVQCCRARLLLNDSLFEDGPTNETTVNVTTAIDDLFTTDDLQNVTESGNYSAITESSNFTSSNQTETIPELNVSKLAYVVAEPSSNYSVSNSSESPSSRWTSLETTASESPRDVEAELTYLDGSITIRASVEPTMMDIVSKIAIDPEPEPESEPKPEGTLTKTEPEPSSEMGSAFAEPGPEWVEAKKEWGVAWLVHVYGFGGVFFFLFLHSFWNIIRISTYSKLLSRHYFMTLNGLMMIVCFFRAFYLLYDPYNSSQILQPISAYFLFNTGFPFFTSSFAVLFLSLLQATRFQMLSPKIQRPSILMLIVCFHLIFSIATDIIVGSTTSMFILVTVCQLMFISWSLCLSIAYFYVFRKLYRSACRSHSEVMRTAFTSIHVGAGKLPRRFPRPVLGTAVKITLMSAIFSLLIAVLQVYGMIFVYGLFVNTIPQPWPWWIYQTVFRFLEVFMCFTMIYVGSRPLRHFGSKTVCPEAFMCCRKKPDYFDVPDMYPSRFSGHLQPIIADANIHDQSRSLPGYAYRGDCYCDPLSTSKTLQVKYKNAPLSNASVISAISNNKCNSFLPTARSEGVRSNATISTAASSSRPSSILIKDNGFIRFRQESDLSEEDTSEIEGRVEGRASPEGKESINPQIGSVPDESIFNDDLSFNTSPFFRNGYRSCYNNRLSFASCGSDDTTDVDYSEERLSDLPSRKGRANSRLRKCGSTCSSESAANSFDISMFLSRSIGVQTSSSRPISASFTEDGRYRPISAAVTEDDDGSSVDGHEHLIYARPEASSRPEGLNLDLCAKRTIIPLHVINSPMQDITPDSAVYLDLNISKRNSPDTVPCPVKAIVPMLQNAKNYKKNMQCSQSMNDIFKKSSNNSILSYQRLKKSTESLISRIKGSTFSLNATTEGYEPLTSNDDDNDDSFIDPPILDRSKLRRSASERRHNVNRVRVKSAKYRSVCDVVDGDLEANFLDDICDEDDSGAGDSREDIEMTDEGVQTDPVVILSNRNFPRLLNDDCQMLVEASTVM